MQSQKYLDRTMLSLAFGESALGTKCIDTRPDDTMYANIEQYTLAVERMKNYHGSTARRNTFVLALVLGGLSF
ncbi:MAG: hypothetical protein R3D66_04270 [Alphaproteobacteria bacterium]